MKQSIHGSYSYHIFDFMVSAWFLSRLTRFTTLHVSAQVGEYSQTLVKYTAIQIAEQSFISNKTFIQTEEIIQNNS